MGVPDMDELSVTDSELNCHVRNALKAAIEADDDYYGQLVAAMHLRDYHDAEGVALLVTCLKALKGAVPCISTVHHQRLLNDIFIMSLWNYGTDVMDALIEFLIAMASSHGELVDLCLDMLVVNFMPPFKANNQAFLNQPHGLAKKTQVLERIHSALESIANLVPLSPLRLEKIVRDRMPRTNDGEAETCIYVENVLRLERGTMFKHFGGTSLVALVDKLIEMDVEISWDDILQEDFHMGIFDMEVEDLEKHIDFIDEDCTEVTKEALIQRYLSGNKIAGKLDSLLALAFQHLKSCFESGRLFLVFETLLWSFKKTILTAYKSKFSQFVMFYSCSLDPEGCGNKFVNELVKIFLNSPNHDLRMSAVSYLASYLARAKFVPASNVASTLERVVEWCLLYCKNLGSDVNPVVHKVFYAGCQAIMYVLCFRMRQMVVIPRLKSQLLHMRIEDVLGHPLRPLQVCLPSIVEEFLRLSRENRVFSLPRSLANHGLIESDHSRAFGGVYRLDMFFPFDPCLLKKCDEFIRPNYVYWSMVRSTYDDDGEGTSDDDDDDDVADTCKNRDGMSIPRPGSDNDECSDADEFDYSLDKMSITPRNTLSHKFGGRIQRFEQMPSKIRPSTSPL